jgi:hypothetical protein
MSYVKILRGEPPGHPFRGNQHTDEGGGGSESIPPVPPHKKLTVMEAAKELGKRGYYVVGTPRFSMKTNATVYQVKDKGGNTVEVSGKEITAFLKGKTKTLKVGFDEGSGLFVRGIGGHLLALTGEDVRFLR